MSRKHPKSDLGIFTFILSKTDLTDPDNCWPCSITPNTQYPQIRIKDKRHQIHIWVHKYINTSDPLTVTRPYTIHWCDNKRCIKPDHLRSGSNRENIQDAIRNKKVIGRLTEDQINEIKRRSGLQKNLAKEFGVSQATISDVIRGVRG